MSCGSCGATLRPDATFCGQCFGTLTTSGAVTAVGLRTAPAAELPHEQTFSRWRKTSSTFGPLGRVLWTLAMLPVVGITLFSLDPFAMVGAVIVVPLVMRSVWAKGRLT